MRQVDILSKLESYEKLAYDGGIGSDWLATIGETLKLYVEECVSNNKNITMSGFLKKVGDSAKYLLDDSE